MWTGLFIYKAIIVLAMIIEGEGGSLRRINREVAVKNPIYVEINPSLFRLKDAVKLDSRKSRRLKRGKTNDKPSLVLEIAPNFFSTPQLEKLYSTIVGNNGPIKENTKLIFQINPLKIPGINLKRESEGHHDEFDQAAFVLTINPVLPRKVPKARNYNNTCVEKKADEAFCGMLREFSRCPASEPTIPTTTKCKPTKPSKDKEKYLDKYCNPADIYHDGSPNPCNDVGTSTECLTLYTQCKSSPPPTVKPTFPPGCPTTLTCIPHVSQTESTINIIELDPPRVTQKCVKNGSSGNLIQEHRDKYVILARRSPSGTWSRLLRKKREHAKIKFKFHLVPINK